MYMDNYVRGQKGLHIYMSFTYEIEIDAWMKPNFHMQMWNSVNYIYQHTFTLE